jgi:hypothetical protein
LDEDFRGRFLPFDSAAAKAYAPIARANAATVATRNTTDFESCGIQLMDPWSLPTH